MRESKQTTIAVAILVSLIAAGIGAMAYWLPYDPAKAHTNENALPAFDASYHPGSPR